MFRNLVCKRSAELVCCWFFVFSWLVTTEIKPLYSTIIMMLYRNIPGAAEVDLNIPEDFPRASLLKFIDDYIKVCCYSGVYICPCPLN